jgi:hypothetical protein
MANKILIKRGTREQINLAATPGNSLSLGELYLITDEGRLAVGTGSNTYQDFLKANEAAPLDADLTAIAALTGTGILKRTGTNTWTLDTSTYLTSEADTLGTVTGRGATTTTAVTFNGGITVDGTNAANFTGSASGSAKLVAPAAAGTGTVITLPSTTGTLALASAIPTVNTGTLEVSIGTAGATNTSITWGTTSGFNANSSGATTYDLRIGPAISNLASFMTTATAGFIRRTGQDTYGIDTNTYTTTSTSISAFAAAAADVALGGFKITGLGTPGAATDAANKAYVDGAIQGVDTKASVKAATTASLGTVAYNNGTAGLNATLTNTGAFTAFPAVDGVTIALNDRILVKNQPTAAQNGIYTLATVGTGSEAWVLRRAVDNDTWDEIPQSYVFVEQGTQENNGYLFTADQGGTMGTTPITITQFSGAGQITDGNGLLKTGNTLDVRVASNRTVINGNDEVDIASNYAGQTSITTLGTIGAGIWQGTTVGVQYGGTGATTLTGLIKGNGTSAFTAAVPGTDYLDPNSTIDGGTF